MIMFDAQNIGKIVDSTVTTNAK